MSLFCHCIEKLVFNNALVYYNESNIVYILSYTSFLKKVVERKIRTLLTLH